MRNALRAYSKTINDEAKNGVRKLVPFNYKQGFAGNKIKTSKYTWLTFLPKNLIEQFSKFANFFFILLAVMQAIPRISITDGSPTILLPLFLVISISMLKDLYEDWKRKKSDRTENYHFAQVYDDKGQF